MMILPPPPSQPLPSVRPMRLVTQVRVEALPAPPTGARTDSRPTARPVAP